MRTFLDSRDSEVRVNGRQFGVVSFCVWSDSGVSGCLCPAWADVVQNNF